MESGEEQKDKKISRRNFLRGSAYGALGIGSLAVGGTLLTRMEGEKDRLNKLLSPEVSSSPEVLDPTITEFGFNTHVRSVTSEGDNHTLEMFKQNVDQLVVNNQDWIRFNLRVWEFAQAGEEKNSVDFNENLNMYDEAIAYANKKGLKIFLVTNVPEFAKDYSVEDYKEVASDFYKKIANRFKGQIDIWQIFNEPDIHNFRDYRFSLDFQRDVGYLDELVDLVSVANSAIKEVDQNALTTVNLSGYKTDLIEKGSFFFDHLTDIDVLSLDLYPGENIEEIERLPEYVEHFRTTYDKPVFIAELGLPTIGTISEDDQATYVRASINSLKRGKFKAMGIALYEMTDQTVAGGNAAQKNFGFEYADGTPKKALAQVLEVMQK